MELRLAGRCALVTGAASGIGRAVAVQLAQEGMRVGMIDRDAAGLQQTLAAVADAAACTRVADVTDEQQVDEAVQGIVAELGGLHTVVGCAGISGPMGSGIDEISREEWDAVFAVNVTGAFLVLRRALPALRAAADASVVLLASDSASVASPGMVPYCASKAALAQFARALSVDLGDDGIRVVTVSPSIVDTPMSRGDLGLADGFDGVPYAVQTPQDIAAHVAYLASPLARTINGTGILSDFGYSARSGFPA